MFGQETIEGQKLPVGSIRQQFVSKKLENMIFFVYKEKSVYLHTIGSRPQLFSMIKFV